MPKGPQSNNSFGDIALSVFFPAYNEGENITSTVEKAITVLNRLGLRKWEVLVINDGSTDNTEKKGQLLVKKYKEVKVITQPNGGYGMALRAGFTNAQYEYIFYTDGDGQFDFAEIDKFLAKIKETDFIIGYRIKRQDPFYRTILAKIWGISIFFVYGFMLRDIDCGFKMIRKKVIDTIGPLQSERGAMINAELVIKAKKAGFRISQIGVQHYPRLAGSPTGANLKVAVRSYIDLIRLRLKLR